VLRARASFFRNLLVATDTCVVAGSVIAAYFVRFGPLARWYPPAEAPDTIGFARHSIPVIAATAITMLVFLASNLYVARRDQRLHVELRAILRATVMAVLLTFAFVSFFSRILFDGRDPSRLQYVTWAGLLFVSMTVWRIVFRSAVRKLRRRGWNLRHVAIIGTGRLGQIACRTLRRNGWTGLNPVYFVTHEPRATRPQCLDLPVRGGLEDLEAVLEQNVVSGVFIALPARRAGELPRLLERLQRFPVDVRVVPDMNPSHLPINMTAGELEGMPILSIRETPLAGWGGVTKRALDLVGGLAALAIFAVPMAVIAVLVRLSGPGPVIFRQERMSLNGQCFSLFKFRTMRTDLDERTVLARAAEAAGAAAAEEDPETGPADAAAARRHWTRRDDPRITGVGRFLRKTSLDELPQLFNVLLGEMSLVGPRPERPELIARFRDDWRGYMLRQNVKAGMTGWAQVNGLRGDTSLRKRLQYDLFYIRNWSLLFDLRILWMTIFRGFVHPNAH